jgi:hypothetical protein
MPTFAPGLPLDALLAASQADPRFRADVLAYAAAEPAARLRTHGHAPRVKVLRVVAQLLAAEPELRIESAVVTGSAGCSDFRGLVTVFANGIERTWDFVWDCRWRARESGVLDDYGYPDQARAAREFGWQCFATWRERRRASRTGTDG